MNNLFNKDLILTRVDFDKSQKPRLKLGDTATGEIYIFRPEFEKEITLEIDTSKRFCIGWHDLKSGEDFLCPENSIVDKKYEQCSACQRRTGFNPAFYNASESDISEQQIERNSQPHFVYLAYFSDEIIKVGISFAGRGIARLLEQGARCALILGEFSSANVARSYEEKISKMPDFCENVKASAKERELPKKLNFEKASTKLLKARDLIAKALNVNFEQNTPINLQIFYSSNGEIPQGEFISAKDLPQTSPDKTLFSGILKAQVGYFWLAENSGEILSIPLKKFTGHKVKLLPTTVNVELPERQASLFDF